MFERRAPESLARIEKLLDPSDRIGQGNWLKNVSDELLAAMTEAYREAVKRGVTV